MVKLNENKANKLYTAIDNSNFYSNPVEKASRSWMNVPFVLASADLDKEFLAGAENIGPAGVTLVIVRDDLIGNPLSITPGVFDYAQQAEADSMLNTPPTYALYLAGLVFKWVKEQGGLSAMAKLNENKANKLYATIDDSNFYSNPVEKVSRSWMNIPFVLANADLDKEFLAGAEDVGLTTLKGHRSVGGMRASIYNAMPEAGVDALIDYMKDFEKRKA